MIDMKHILLYAVFFIFLAACQKEDDYIYENPFSLGDIKMISLRADHKTLLPDGVATMKFYVTAYGIKELPKYETEMVDDTVKYFPSVGCDTFVIPADILPAGILKVYDETGKEYPDLAFTTTDTAERDIRFYARAGELESNELTVHIRKLPEEEYEELVFPVIFHVLNSAPTIGTPTFKITAEAVKKNLDRLNQVFNRLITTDPNGGSARIRFEAAKYDPSGMKLPLEGIHQWNISGDENLDGIDDYEEYVNKQRVYLLYDYRHYLNVWLIDGERATSSSAMSPTVILPDESIPGLNASDWPVNGFPLTARDVGIFIGMQVFLNPMSNTDFFEISKPMAQYFGLLSTEVSTSNGVPNIVNGDTDYCPDTYYYYNDNSSVFKDTSEEGVPDEETEYFTSYNIMDAYSKKTSITVDQAARIRQHIQKCPSRWMYKSKYPFTGRTEDWDEIIDMYNSN